AAFSGGYGLELADGGESAEALRERVDAGELYCLLAFKGMNAYGLPDFEATIKQIGMDGDGGLEIGAMVRDSYFRYLISEYGLPDEVVAAYEGRLTVTMEETGKSMIEVFMPVYICIFVMYFAFILYSQYVITSVVVEKSTRVMEILITSVRPFTLMVGKLVGMCLLGISQFAALILVGVASATAGGSGIDVGGLNFDFSSLSIPTYAMMVVYFVLGFFLYSSFNAAAGSMVSRMEEAGAASMPVMMLVIIGFFATFSCMFQPSSPLAVFLSYFPLTAPMVMYMRIAISEVPPWEVALSVVTISAAILGVLWLAAKIYRMGVLLYGKKMRFKDMLSALRAK
ncbi:MAG: ABC transporter permease, partial [Oscillospiraceae bacterium]|nr:ABC transporter permease [Oscillospiraceae bacterium]